MNDMIKKELKMRKLSSREVGDLCRDMISLHSGSPDPFASVMYTLNIEPCLALVQEASTRFERKITFAHVLNKLLAMAINENPVYNRVVLGPNVYELEGIHISNAFQLPGRELAITYVILDNPHLKTLAEIQEESIIKMVQEIRANARPKNRSLLAARRLFFWLRLYCLVPEKVSFSVGFKTGVVSNIVLSNHDYGGPANFRMLKCVISRVRVPLRIHTSAVGRQPYVEPDGSVRSRETMHLTMMGDHRITYGIHAHRLGQSLQRLCAEPEKYLV